MDELSKDLNFLLDSNCTNSIGYLLDQPPPTSAPASITPKRKRIEEASSKGKVLLCFFPNSMATSVLMETATYQPKYEMVIPKSWKLKSVLKKLNQKWSKINLNLCLQARYKDATNFPSPPQQPAISPVLDQLDMTLEDLSVKHKDVEGSISFEYSWTNIKSVPQPQPIAEQIHPPSPPPSTLVSNELLHISEYSMNTIGDNTCFEALSALEKSPDSQSSRTSLSSGLGSSERPRKVKKRIAPTFLGPSQGGP
mmetsp:Transcript_15851/g.18703  ORF Transcript_15851/g.18703 Transcript_15851/m.18703 type:complete len:253 (-) Transcript_15851:187-945(-)|eukprot:CAMPEP_0114352752 /NCGR_PEP_ID=MMETSP0101-20121206/18165_1 /TAXON_ID=38822 ORGANISM="Pteridomonas danica, Strain PT" /NCGR_SAMPLE_ID=MMETSP0101 /ASSEMBLY_ACC=CAM_ASM_000211 /LENGTH=252 /DNA_ID=CAMNT_0001493277 /DNA_START=102 /DNA_END=860 /DNA_ORIENTATION=+